MSILTNGAIGRNIVVLLLVFLVGLTDWPVRFIAQRSAARRSA